LKIQLEDNKDYQKALDYIGKLEFPAVGWKELFKTVLAREVVRATFN
jgi:hypothetical protein